MPTSLAQLVYTPQHPSTSNEHPHTFVAWVDEDLYYQRQRDASIPLAQVVDTFTVFRYDLPGMSGQLERPSNRELEETFGTSKADELLQYMLEHGELHGTRRVR
jgi:ribosome maturation protein Sdo1